MRLGDLNLFFKTLLGFSTEMYVNFMGGQIKNVCPWANNFIFHSLVKKGLILPIIKLVNIK